MTEPEALEHIQVLAWNAIEIDDVRSLQLTLRAIVVLTEKACRRSDTD
jgi:hypothetical protein